MSEDIQDASAGPAVGARVHHFLERQAADRPDAPALFGEALAGDASSVLRLDWAGYLAAVDEVADVLRAHGARAGDRVLVVAENCPVAAVSIFAATRIGAVAVPVNARFTAAELERVTVHAEPVVTLYTADISTHAAAHARAAGARPLATSAGTIELAEGVGKAIDPDGDLGDAAVILYTTGTTGAPKGVILTHGNLCFAAHASMTLRDLSPADTLYGVLPLTHVFGIASVLMASACAGATLRLDARFRPERLHAALLDGVNVFPAVPQMHALLMAHVREQGLDKLEGSRLRYVSSGAAPLDPAWKRQAEAFYGIALQNGYGLTESTAGVCGTRNPIGSDDTSAGRPFPGIEVSLDLSVGSSAGSSPGSSTGTNDAEVGEILTRGAHVMQGYFRNPAETARAIDAAGWLRTGDLGRIDADGRLHVVGRCKELIIRGGFNVYPPEVEAALNDHPDVVQAAVIGRTLEGGNEEILAFVQCSDPARMDEGAMKAFVGARLASYKRPSRVIFTTALPAAATGKVLKHRLLVAFAEELGGGS